MNRRQFLAATVGGLMGGVALAKTPQAPTVIEGAITSRYSSKALYEQYVKRSEEFQHETRDYCAEVTGPWRNPVDVLTELLHKTCPSPSINKPSFARVAALCEKERAPWMMTSNSQIGRLSECSAAAKADLIWDDGVFFLIDSPAATGNVFFWPQ